MKPRAALPLLQKKTPRATLLPYKNHELGLLDSKVGGMNKNHVLHDMAPRRRTLLLLSKMKPRRDPISSSNEHHIERGQQEEDFFSSIDGNQKKKEEQEEIICKQGSIRRIPFSFKKESFSFLIGWSSSPSWKPICCSFLQGWDALALLQDPSKNGRRRLSSWLLLGCLDGS